MGLQDGVRALYIRWLQTIVLPVVLVTGRCGSERAGAVGVSGRAAPYAPREHTAAAGAMLPERPTDGARWARCYGMMRPHKTDGCTVWRNAMAKGRACLFCGAHGNGWDKGHTQGLGRLCATRGQHGSSSAICLSQTSSRIAQACIATVGLCTKPTTRGCTLQRHEVKDPWPSTSSQREKQRDGFWGASNRR